MRRRGCLHALLAGLALGPGAALGAAPRPEGDCVLDGPQGAWLLGAAGTLQPLPHAVPPVATAGAVWTAALDGARGAVQCWRRRPEGGWAVAATQALEGPVHALAASADGRHSIAAHGQHLAVIGADGGVLAAFEGRDLARRRQGRAEALFALAARRSFVASWPALGELWEISLDPAAAPIYDGLVHDYRMGEGIAKPGLFGARRTPLAPGMPAIEFAEAGLPWVAARADGGVAIVHLDVRRRVAMLPLADARPAAGALVRSPDREAWWLPAGDRVHLVDARRWTVLASHAAPAPRPVLQALDDRIAALGGDPAMLWLWQDGRWQARPEIGAVAALGSDAAAGQWLVVAGSPPALLRLDREGRRLDAIALPADLRSSRVQAVPA